MSIEDHKDAVYFGGDRQSFPDFEGWKISKKGQPYIRLDNGFVITIYQREFGWSGAIYDPATKKTIFAKRRYSSEKSAKLSAYDSVELLIARRSKLTSPA